MNEKNKGIRASIGALNLNECVTFALDAYKYNSIRSTVFALSVELDRMFTTSLNRGERTITVTRTR